MESQEAMAKQKEEQESEEVKKPTIWDKLTTTNGKIGIVVALFVGFESLKPYVTDLLGLDDDIEAAIEECKGYTDSRIAAKDSIGDQWLDYLIYEVDMIKKKNEIDSLTKDPTFAVGLRSDLDGIYHYRNRHKKNCSVRVNKMTNPYTIEYYEERKQEWLPILFEDL